MTHYSVFHAAKKYAARGFSVLPVELGTKMPPRGYCWRGAQTRPLGERGLRRVFEGACDLGVAAVCGSVSGGLACRDFDKAGAYREWAAAHADLAATLPTVETRRGHHVLFRTELEAFAAFDDGELLADRGHYVVLPPSHVEYVEEDGSPVWHRRRFINPLPKSGEPLPLIDPIAAGLMGEQRRRATEPKAAATGRVLSADGFAPILPGGLPDDVQRAILATLPSGPGERNSLLFDLARLLKYRPGGELHEDVLREAVATWTAEARKARTRSVRTNWRRFIEGYRDAKHAPGSGPRMTAAVAAAGSKTTARAKVEALVRSLADGSGRFFVGCTDAAGRLGLSSKTVWRELMRLRGLGIIAMVRKGERADGPTGRATEWQLIGATPAPETESRLPAPSRERIGAAGREPSTPCIY